MNKNAMLAKLKRTPKWKLKKEREEVQEQQKIIRVKLTELEDALDKLKDTEIAALKANDGDAVALVDDQIKAIEKKIENLDKRYKANADVLEIYSKIIKNDREGNSSTASAWAGWVTALGGLALGAIGLKKAYDADVSGELTNKKTLDWTQRLPIFRNFGKK